MVDFEGFIVRNADADIPRLLLSCKDWPRDKDLAISTIEARKKIRKKVPEWYRCTSLVYPDSLCAEQGSSSVTAFYKADLAGRILEGTEGKVADLTGGLGVDSWAFSKVAAEVLYNEMGDRLAAAARHNFTELGAGNVRVSGMEATPSTIARILEPFRPDLVFIDPARRSSDGRKVFLIEDCSPDVLGLLPGIFSICRHLLLKLSPMADISMVVERLNRTWERNLEAVSGTGWNGNWVREIHVVASGGECKELLVWMDRNWSGEYSMTCREDGGILSFGSAELAQTAPPQLSSVYAPVLFEPGKSFTKAGVTNALCQRFGMVKLARFTHLLTFEGPYGETVRELQCFGKVFPVIEILPFDKRSVKEVARRYPRCEVTARNIPLTSEELRSRLGVSSGGDVHVFGARVETPFQTGNFLFVCRKV